VAVKVRPGQKVQAGQCLVVLEAMKMQNEVPAPADGTVQEVRVREGQLVEARDVLVVLA
jgi:glutaconyl-CoA decarboxylase